MLKETHGATGGHFGIAKIKQKIRKDASNTVAQTAQLVLSLKDNEPKIEDMRQSNVGAPFKRIALDLTGPFSITESDSKYILVLTLVIVNDQRLLPFPTKKLPCSRSIDRQLLAQ